MNLERAGTDWPPAVVGGVYQSGVNLMRDLIRRGVRAVGVDCDLTHQGFRSVYGKSYACPHPDTHPGEWLNFMKSLAERLGAKPVIMPSSDIFVSALGTHAKELESHFVFSRPGVPIQLALTNKESQYELARQHGLPRPNTQYVESSDQLRAFTATARFPCVLKPRQQREWDSLPIGNLLRGRKVISSNGPEEMLAHYQMAAPYRPEAVAQELIVGPETAKYCYIAVYGGDGSRLGYCVVQEWRSNPIFFGPATFVVPAREDELVALCDGFFRNVGYVGICEIEMKRDERDGMLKLIEVNARYTGTGDTARYIGVETGWLHYLDLLGKGPEPMVARRFNFRHVVLKQDVAAFPQYLEGGYLTWGEWLKSFLAPLEFHDVDLRDWRVTADVLGSCARVLGGMALRKLGLRARKPGV